MYPGQRLSSSTTKNTFNIFIMKSFGAIMNAWPPRRPTASEVQDTSPAQTPVLMNNSHGGQGDTSTCCCCCCRWATFIRVLRLWSAESWGKLQFLFISGHRPGGSCCWPSAAVPNNHNNCAMGVDVVNFARRHRHRYRHRQGRQQQLLIKCVWHINENRQKRGEKKKWETRKSAKEKGK